MVSRRIHEALTVARHELVGLNGMLGADGMAPNETFKIDTSEALERIDEAMKEGGLGPIQITPRKRRAKTTAQGAS